jgi:spermidine/putrescine transport system substrate-binding protein
MPWMDEELTPAVAPEDADLLSPASAEKENEQSLTHLTWTGYAAENVQQPFRNSFNASTNIELFSALPKAFRRLKAGEWKQYDHTTFDMAWLKQLREAEIIRPIDYESWKPYIWDPLVDAFSIENGYKYGSLNEDNEFDVDGQVFGVPQRWGWNTLNVNADTVDESHWNTYDVAWMSDNYDIGVNDYQWFYTMQTIMLREGIEPYKEHTEDEIEQVRQATFDLFDGATTLLSDYASINQALVNNEIDVFFQGSGFLTYGSRSEGATNIISPVPTDKKNGLNQCIIWVESTSLVRGSHASVSDNYLAYMMNGESAYELSWPKTGAPNVVPHQTAWERYSEEQSNILMLDRARKALDNAKFYEGVPDLQKFEPIWREAKTRI